MNRNKRIILSAIVVIILLMGVGYAAFTNITLNINATSKIIPAIFEVVFVSEPPRIAVDPASGMSTTSTINVTAPAPAEGATSATIDVSGLHNAGDAAYVTFKVTNKSEVDASKVSLFVSQDGKNNTKNSYTTEDGLFTFSAVYTHERDTELPVNDIGTVEVTIVLNKRIEDGIDKDASCVVNIIAEPTQV